MCAADRIDWTSCLLPARRLCVGADAVVGWLVLQLQFLLAARGQYFWRGLAGQQQQQQQWAICHHSALARRRPKGFEGRSVDGRAELLRNSWALMAA